MFKRKVTTVIADTEQMFICKKTQLRGVVANRDIAKHTCLPRFCAGTSEMLTTEKVGKTENRDKIQIQKKN